jgi:5'-phosphate synthase pdxT subunit
MVGVLALQGDFGAHGRRLDSLGVKSKEVRVAEDLADITGIIIPGGESSVLLKLLEPELEQALIKTVRSGVPTLATCAGLILLASQVKNPEQRSLGLLNIGLTRNAYGRQVDSFIHETTTFTEQGKELLARLNVEAPNIFESVFIRAPKIDWAGNEVSVLVEEQGCPTLVCQGNVLGATFHPELSDSTDAIYRLLFRLKGDVN